MPVSTDLLRLVPLFRGMTDRSFEVIANLASETTFGAGDVLVRQGEAGHEFLIIVSGRAKVERDGQPVRDLGPGDFLGRSPSSMPAREPRRSLPSSRSTRCASIAMASWT